MVKIGDKVKLDNKELTVTGTWGQGRHRAYSLSDGRTVLDLHLLIERGQVELLPTHFPVTTKPLRFQSEVERLPHVDEDHEE